MCQHLAAGHELRYYQNLADGKHPAMAWCEECQRILDEERGWNDRSEEFAGLQLFCSCCFSETLCRHALAATFVD
jgi:hypothetical protein